MHVLVRLIIVGIARIDLILLIRIAVRRGLNEGLLDIVETLLAVSSVAIPDVFVSLAFMILHELLALPLESFVAPLGVFVFIGFVILALDESALVLAGSILHHRLVLLRVLVLFLMFDLVHRLPEGLIIAISYIVVVLLGREAKVSKGHRVRLLPREQVPHRKRVIPPKGSWLV